MAITRGESFTRKVNALMAKGFSRKRAESFAAFNTTARQIGRKTWSSKVGR